MRSWLLGWPQPRFCDLCFSPSHVVLPAGITFGEDSKRGIGDFCGCGMGDLDAWYLLH